jgi:dimethylargininase
MGRPPRVFARDVSNGFATALTTQANASTLDAARAREQHAAYVAGLRGLGLDVAVIAGDDGLPDCCFIEDTAIDVGGEVLLTRPGAPSRLAEVEAVGAALMAAGVPVTRMEAPAQLDGGDVLRVGRTLFVGRSARTNAAGCAALGEFAVPRGYEVVPITLPAGVLHLKCHISAPLPDLVVMVDGIVPRSALPDGVRVVIIPDDEAYAANLVGWDGVVLCPEGFPETVRRLEAVGVTVRTLDTTQFRAADGSLTCLSLFVGAC